MIYWVATGFNSTLRLGNVTHHEYVQVGLFELYGTYSALLQFVIPLCGMRVILQLHGTFGWESVVFVSITIYVW